jgi:hypothetical protein
MILTESVVREIRSTGGTVESSWTLSLINVLMTRGSAILIGTFILLNDFYKLIIELLIKKNFN